MKNSILFLSNAYPDFESSYRGIFIKKMATLLKSEGYTIRVVTPKIYKGSSYFGEQDGLGVYRFPFFAKNKLLIEYKKIPYLKMIFYYISGFLFTIYVMVKSQCNLIHVHWAIPPGLIGVWAGRLLRKPVVVTIHGSDFRMATEGSNLLKKIFLYVCQKAERIICVSKLQAGGIQKLGVEGEKISTLPMGVDEEFVESGRDREKKVDAQGHIVLSNRNLLPIYNVSLLIRAIPGVIHEEPGVRFLIAGEGPERENLEGEAEKLNIDRSIQFIGRVPHVEMPNLLAKADIYVSTSLHDGTSISLLEAMASGSFPIVTDIPSNREWISDGENGFLVPRDDEEYLARRIIESLHNPSLLEKSCQKNLSIIGEKALWPMVIKKIEAIYNETLNAKKE
jgi:glycosyltransferase involved in cell wall biosynthesis